MSIVKGRTDAYHYGKEEEDMRKYVCYHKQVQNGPIHHVPPHERKDMLHVEFDERDRATFETVFGDEDTAEAAIKIIHNSPPEIQILAVQMLKMIEEVE